jgi:hypothetical protein
VESLRALYTGHPRRAVIEAFTALEVTLSLDPPAKLGDSGRVNVKGVL